MAILSTPDSTMNNQQSTAIKWSPVGAIYLCILTQVANILRPETCDNFRREQTIRKRTCQYSLLSQVQYSFIFYGSRQSVFLHTAAHITPSIHLFCILRSASPFSGFTLFPSFSVSSGFLRSHFLQYRCR